MIQPERAHEGEKPRVVWTAGRGRGRGQVSRIKAGGWAEGSGAVAAGDVIVSVGGVPCRGSSLEKITRLLQV